MSKKIKYQLETIFNTDKVIKKTNVSGGIIFKEQPGEKPALLLIQRAKKDHWPNFWEYPRGGCENRETLIACLKREIKEETGLDIIPLKFIDKFSYTADEGKRLSTQHNFLCKMKDPKQKIKLSKEHQGFQWITTPGEAEMTVLPEMKRSIMKAFEIIDPNTKIVNYPENNFTPDNSIEENTMDLQEKIQLSEDLVDKYLNEAADLNALVSTGAYVASTAAQVSGEIRRGYDWAKEKMAERRKQKELMKQQKEKEKQKIMLAKKQQQRQKQRMS